MKLLLKIQTFLKALFWHIYSGSPKSSSSTIIQRYIICKNCERFDNENSQCLICGCNISSQKRFMNKLAWSDQECPIGKWKKE